jgi:uncharacterized membrane protein (DUF2068 family)
LQRPTGVTILSVLHFIGAGLYLLVALGAFTGGSVFMAASADMRGQFGWGIFALIGVVCLIFAGLCIAIGIGFWKLLNWSRVLQIVLLILFLGFQILLIVGAMMHFGATRVILRVIIMSIEVWILTYLFKANVKRAFGAASL